MLTSFALVLTLVATPQQGVTPTSQPAAPAYDPLAVDADFEPATHDLVVKREVKKGWRKKEVRDVPVLIYMPATESPAPVVLFSHGLGGERTGSAFLGKHWAARGLVAVYPQHAGSDDSIWKDKDPAAAWTGMMKGASAKNLELRIGDVKAVLDQLERWNADAKHPLFGRLDLQHVGMSGHSFGAVTTQHVTGQATGLFGKRKDSEYEPRFSAALPLSPSSPRLGSSEKAFATVEIPWMLMTGTRDEVPIGGQTPESRREVFRALPQAVPHFELVLDGAEHSVFTERALPGDQAPRNPNHHGVIQALSTAFWESYLKGDPAAHAWLTGDGPRTVMESADLWEVALPEVASSDTPQDR
jgi:dienelactone hydrolase